MAFILGVFDLLAYAVPGSIYVTVLGYAAHRAGWIDAPSLLTVPTVLLLVAVAVAAFLVGQAASALDSTVDRLNPFRPAVQPERAKEEFLRRNAAAAPRRFLRSDPFTLLAALEADDDEAAAEVSRLRSTGLMLGRCAPPLLLGVAIAVVETATGSLPLFAALTGLVLALVAVGCLHRSAAFGRWAVLRTYELCFWNEGVEARLAEE
jgi:hypothetical protein